MYSSCEDDWECCRNDGAIGRVLALWYRRRKRCVHGREAHAIEILGRILGEPVAREGFRREACRL